jgi:hypothetical protein
VLPSNSSVNTVQYATIDEAVFSTSSAPGNSRNWVFCDELLGYVTVLTIDVCFLCGPCRGCIARFPERPEGVTELVQGSYESVVSWRSESRRIISSEVPE